MTITQHAHLYQKLVQWSPDNDDSAFPFSKRLARENGWTRSYARRVIEEYKRFVFLAIHAGHPVTPSGPIDQAWHLHPTYTQSYCEDLCGNILNQPLLPRPQDSQVWMGASLAGAALETAMATLVPKVATVDAVAVVAVETE